LKKEVVIAGGGLAGLSLAIGLRSRGIPVTVHEAGKYPRHRVCGEFISGVSDETLEALGIEKDLADAVPHRAMRWFRKGREILHGELPDPARGISRWLLDQRLKERVIRDGGKLYEDSRLSRDSVEGIVWAAGRLPRKSQWVGLKCHLLDFKMEDGLEMHLGENGYLGLTPIEDGRVNLCGLFRVDRSIRAKGSALLIAYLKAGGHEALVERILEARREESSFSGVAGFELGWQDGGPDLCAVGDASGMIPPFTGNGMSMAFESSEIALDPLFQWSNGHLEWTGVIHDINRQSRRRFRRRVGSAMKLHQFLLHARGQDLIEAISTRGLLPLRPLISLVR
jgi:flavin-dependent dehydrogenase